jgi:hypothetical protein
MVRVGKCLASCCLLKRVDVYTEEGRLQGEALQAERLLRVPMETTSREAASREAEPLQQEEGAQHIQ